VAVDDSPTRNRTLARRGFRNSNGPGRLETGRQEAVGGQFPLTPRYLCEATASQIKGPRYHFRNSRRSIYHRHSEKGHHEHPIRVALSNARSGGDTDLWALALRTEK